MNAKQLNRLPRAIFSYKSEIDQKVKVCNADGSNMTLSRDKLISAGRLATCEYFGRIANNDKNSTEKYVLKVNDYASYSRNVWEQTVLFCAAQANRQIGKAPYSTMKEVEDDRSLYGSQTFFAALQSIATEVITPLLPAITDDVTSRLISWTSGRLGETKMIDIESNDFFVYDDDSWGAVSSKPRQRLYKSQVALTPKLHTAKASIKWYQDVIDGEAGRFYAAFARGAANKTYSITLEKFKGAVGNTKYVPSAFVLDGFSMDNWNKALMWSQAINGVTRNNLMALGTLSGLSNIVPTIGADGVIAGAQGEIGTEWTRNGFLANVSGVDLVEAGLSVVPGTQNYDPKFVSLDDPEQENVYIVAKIGHAPMAGVMASGAPITITLTPTETSDMTIEITETLAFDIVPVFSSKIFKMMV